MSDKKFASHADLEEKKVSFRASCPTTPMPTPPRATPNTGVDHRRRFAVMIIDATATPVMAQDVIRLRAPASPTSRSSYVTLTHYHAVRVLGASGYKAEGLQDRSSPAKQTRELIVERGQQDMDSEIGRFPRLFNAVESRCRA
jgi:glyoxylase-like metal-dependent hydrolase (beta-lactamase superfamily II)